MPTFKSFPNRIIKTPAGTPVRFVFFDAKGKAEVDDATAEAIDTLIANGLTRIERVAEPAAKGHTRAHSAGKGAA